jgi:hypothetical protein
VANIIPGNPAPAIGPGAPRGAFTVAPETIATHLDRSTSAAPSSCW